MTNLRVWVREHAITEMTFAQSHGYTDRQLMHTYPITADSVCYELVPVSREQLAKEATEENNEEVKATNKVLLDQAMELLYQTHICNADSAKDRGEAIRAIARILERHGDSKAIQRKESVSWQKRMETSEVWNDPKINPLDEEGEK